MIYRQLDFHVVILSNKRKKFISSLVLQGYRAEMDNPTLSGVLPPILRSKRDILFGNMPEIYNFHSRQVTKNSHHTSQHTHVECIICKNILKNKRCTDSKEQNKNKRIPLNRLS